MLILLIAAAALPGQEAEVRNPRTSLADVAAGAKTFRSHCSPCHGLNGEGGRGPNLAAGRFYHGSSDADLLRNISTGIPGTEMPALFYNADRIWQIVAYIRSLSAAPAAPVGDPARGKALFSAKGCPQCHRVRGEGGRLGPDLTTIGESRAPAYLRQSLLDPDAVVLPPYWVVRFRDDSGRAHEGFLLNEDTYTVQFLDFQSRLHSMEKSGLQDYRVEKKSRMPSFRGALSDAALQDLVAYLSSLRSPGGSR